jgi:hypothetical protein
MTAQRFDAKGLPGSNTVFVEMEAEKSPRRTLLRPRTMLGNIRACSMPTYTLAVRHTMPQIMASGDTYMYMYTCR